jgi:transcriptional regulator with XRE-family HTH domain
MENIVGLGSRIRMARLQKGMTGAVCAQAAGISRQGLDNIEAGRTPNPRVAQVVAIAQALQVRVMALLDIED